MMAKFTGWIGDTALTIIGRVASFEDKVTSVRQTTLPKTQEKIRYGKAMLCRGIFFLHGLIAIWRVVDICKAPVFCLLGIPIILLPLELILTIRFAKKENGQIGEWKWFCPSVFLYLASVIPAIWILHVDRYREKWANHLGLDACAMMPMLAVNETSLQTKGGISIPLELPCEWLSSLQQVMFVVLVGGRWLLPKGHLTRSGLSQLLMFYIGIAGDSLEFSVETIMLETVNSNIYLMYSVLALWTWSMMQFTLVRPCVIGIRDRKVIDTKQDVNSRSVNAVVERCFESEICSILLTILLQDGPFLIMRLILMIRFHVFNHMMLFFVIKNILVVLIQLYSVFILIFPGSVCINGERRHDEAHDENGNFPEECHCYCHNKHGQFVEQKPQENHQNIAVVDVEMSQLSLE